MVDMFKVEMSLFPANGTNYKSSWNKTSKCFLHNLITPLTKIQCLSSSLSRIDLFQIGCEIKTLMTFVRTSIQMFQQDHNWFWCWRHIPIPIPTPLLPVSPKISAGNTPKFQLGYSEIPSGTPDFPRNSNSSRES